MFHMKDGLPPRVPRCALSVFFLHIMLLLQLPHFCKGISQVIGSPQPIVANIGDDIVLPCHLKPAMDAASQTVEWARQDLNPRFVHVWRSGEDLLDDQHPSFVGRTSLFVKELKSGNVSLKLSNVKLSDRGTYRCFIPIVNRDSTVELVFGSVSSPDIKMSKTGNGVLLNCQSKGWFTEPEVLWHNSEGKVLSAGGSETSKGPHGHYTVNNRLIVEKRDGGSFTCRVHHSNINQTKETTIQISADFFKTSFTAAFVSIIVVLVLLLFAVSAFAVWKLRRKQAKEIKAENKEKLMAEAEREDMQKISEEEELKEVKNLEELNKELKGQKDQLDLQNKERRQIIKDFGSKIESAKKTAEEDQAKGFLEMEGIAVDAIKQLEKGIHQDNCLNEKTIKMRRITDDLLKRKKTRQMEVENEKKKREELGKMKKLDP